MQIIDRATWGARYPDGFGPAPLPAREVWLHHTATEAPDLVPPFDDEDLAVRQLEEVGQRRFGGGISYTLLVMPSGRAYEGHSVDREGAHTKGRNSIARAIALVGNYDEDEPTDAQVETTAQLLVAGWVLGWWISPQLNGGHRHAPGAATVCPGRYGAGVISDINTRAAELAAGAHSQEEPEVALSPEDADLVARRVVALLIDGRRDVNLTALLRVAKAADRRVDALDDFVAVAVDDLRDRLDDIAQLVGGRRPPAAAVRLVPDVPSPGLAAPLDDIGPADTGRHL